MEPVSGTVAVVQLGAGRGDMVTVFFEGDSKHGHTFDALAGDVFCDGNGVTASEFFAWFLKHNYPIMATLYPDESRYMNATKAEFTSS